MLAWRTTIAGGTQVSHVFEVQKKTLETSVRQGQSSRHGYVSATSGCTNDPCLLESAVRIGPDRELFGTLIDVYKGV